MKGIFSLLVLICLISNSALAAKVVFTSNVPELFAQENGYSLAKMSAFVKRLKQGQEPVLFIHGGDSLSPNPLSVYDKGAHMISIMNAMGVDVLAVNRREFNEGIDQVTLLSSKAQFPMVLSNLHDRRTMSNVEGVLPYVILPVGDLNVAVLMTVSESINSTFLFNTAAVYESAEQINRWVNQARISGADKVILVTERDYLKKVPVDSLVDIDVVFVTQDVVDKQLSESPLVIASGGVDDEMVVLEMSAESVSAEVVHTADEQPDALMNSVISRYTSQLDVVLGQQLATLAGPMDSLRETLRSAESSWGNIVVDAVRQYTQADFAAIIGGSIRGYREYETGYVLTRRDIQRELPFGGTVYVVKLSPTKLKQVLEHGVSDVEGYDGRFLQVSGLRYQYDANRPVGSRIVSLTDASGQPLTASAYTLAISDYMFDGGDGYDFTDSNVVSDKVSSQRLMWNIVSDYLEQFDTIMPALEGRIENLTVSQ
ncbi:Trifunctional nucleotide phosphoesterase protein YfkN precursor [Marinomonas aquimarina]|uniref:Trifunctional nucleotide phosphoesterase protein YfkN n=1 Tax=Marinomonas aquimarina TaxID=295068 RepID=A0A1A8THW6_9GAMM|nr:5'-nucleotidase C-terminal domain-containing protein [Marinomonas aquimarina]SBS32878.1 Trifunctional nucleotide phosphoesterase protein YfkN precursor [Marinomonas aquimarina]